MNVLFAASAFWASTWYRSHVVANELRKKGHKVVLTDMPTKEQVENCDVFCTRMWIDEKIEPALSYCKELGKPYILDIDDDVWHLHPDNPGFLFYSNPEIAAKAKGHLKYADRVTSSTAYLANRVKDINKNSVVLENRLPIKNWPSKGKDLSNKEKLVIGWVGSSSHAPDIKMLSGVVESIIREYSNVEFLFVKSVSLPFSVNKQIKLEDPVRIENYQSLVNKIDIGLIPTIDNEFNRAKSDLKVIEYGICGIPSIASKVVPYELGIKHGIDGFVAKNSKDWLKFIKKLLNDRELLVSMSKEARISAENKTIDKYIDKWEQALTF